MHISEDSAAGGQLGFDTPYNLMHGQAEPQHCPFDGDLLSCCAFSSIKRLVYWFLLPHTHRPLELRLVTAKVRLKREAIVLSNVTVLFHNFVT